MNFNLINIVRENFWPKLNRENVYPLFNEERALLPQDKKVILQKEIDSFRRGFKRKRNFLLISNVILYFSYSSLFPYTLCLSLGYIFMKSQNLKSLPSYLKRHSPKVKALFGNLYKYNQQRSLKYDPTTLSIHDLQIGFLVDYKTRTYQVFEHYEQSLDDHFEEKFSIIEAATDHNNQFNELIIFKDNIKSTPEIYVGVKVNVYSIKNDLDTEIRLRGKAENTYQFYNTNYFLEYYKSGLTYSLKDKKVIGPLKKWFYLNETRDKFLSIYQINSKEFEAYNGEIVNDAYFTDILPR